MIPDATDRDTQVLLAVLRLSQKDFPVYYSELLMATGIRSGSNLHASLHRLRNLGLVAFEDGKNGTLRPLVRAVAVRTP